MELSHEKKELKVKAFDFAVFVLGAAALIVGFSSQNAIVFLIGLGIMFLPVHFMHNYHDIRKINKVSITEGSAVEMAANNETKELFVAMDRLMEKLPVADIENFDN